MPHYDSATVFKMVGVPVLIVGITVFKMVGVPVLIVGIIDHFIFNHASTMSNHYGTEGVFKMFVVHNFEYSYFEKCIYTF